MAKVKRINKPFARRYRFLQLWSKEQKVAGKNQQAKIAKAGKEAIRRKHGN